MTKNEILASIGLIVLETQIVESLLNLVLTFVLQDGTPLTCERIVQLEKHQRRQTLGSFYKAMRGRADYSQGLVDVFERFLENRNKLIHRFREVEGHELSSDDDFVKVQPFLVELHQDTWNLVKFLAAWIIAWQEQTGIGKGSFEKMMPKTGESLLLEIQFMSEFVKDHVFMKE